MCETGGRSGEEDDAGDDLQPIPRLGARNHRIIRRSQAVGEGHELRWSEHS